MTTRQRRPSWIKGLILPAVFVLFLGYFGYYAVVGDLGIVGSQRLVSRVHQLEADLQRLRDESRELDSKVAKLRAPDIDEDMLDERARAVLNYVRPEDVVLRPKARLD